MTGDPKSLSSTQTDYAVNLLQRLVRTPSITGDENAVQKILREELHALNLEVDQFQPSPERLKNHPAFSDDGLPLSGRSCLVARWKGSGGGRSLILNGHVDVVPPGDVNAWSESPWSGTVRDGKLYGRGSCDMKGGLVSGLLAISVLQKAGLQPHGDVLVECVIGEETGGVGTLSTILQGYTADAALVLEPTRLQICPVGSGSASFRLHVYGRAAHGSMRMEGVSAIEKFSILHKAILDFEAERHQSFHHPLYKEGPAAPISVGKIQAGDWPSSVPDLLVAEGRYGIFPSESISEARLKFEERIREASRSDDWLKTNPGIVEWFEGQFEPAETPVDSEFIAMLAETHQDIIGQATGMHGVPYGSDLRFFTNYAKIPAVLYGPGNVAQAHAANEYVSLNEVFTAARIVAAMITSWCGL